MTIVEFLRAMFDEDEATCRNAVVTVGDEERAVTWSESSSGVPETGDDSWPIGDSRLSRHFARFDPARVLAECEAKRRIVALHAYQARGATWGECAVCFDPQTGPGEYDFETWPCPTLRVLAAVYADHPDYRPEWRP